MSFDPGLQAGDVVTNQQLCEIFKCGNSGGMRRTRRFNTLVIISDHTKGIYSDQWINKILYYTGMGKTGDQVLNGNQNITLYESNINGVSVYLFEVYVEREYTYRGRVKLAKEPYQTNQADVNGVMRKVWMFPMKLEQDNASIECNVDEKLVDRLAELTDEEINRIEYVHTPKPKEKGSPIVRNDIKIYPRSDKTAINALAYAGFVCEINSSHPTFIRRNSRKNYVEPHHLIPMRYSEEFDYSLDVEENIVSLCSNCHNQLHYGRDYEVLLERLYNERKDLLERVKLHVTLERLKDMYK